MVDESAQADDLRARELRRRRSRAATISHDGDARLARHLGHSRRQDLPGERDEQGQPLWLIRKERPDSPHKIDLAMAAVLSWEARTDAHAAGVLSAPPPASYEMFVI